MITLINYVNTRMTTSIMLFYKKIVIDHVFPTYGVINKFDLNRY